MTQEHDWPGQDPWRRPARSLDTPPPDDPAPAGLVRLALLAALGGAGAGVVGGFFRLLLGKADVLRDDLLGWTREAPISRWVVPVLVVGCLVALARALVRWAPEAGGSGVQRVEAEIRGEEGEPRPRILPVKFVGGLLAIGSGLLLGREGPTVQMGATVGGGFSRAARLSEHDTRTLTVSLAGAGLGVAFNAPLGGSVFVFEEIAHAFRTRLIVATFAGTATALAVSRAIVGGEPVLPVGHVEPGATWMLAAYAVLGALLGLLGVVYNRLVVWLLDAADRLRRIAPEIKAAAVGVVVIAVGIAAPWLIGGGDVLNERILVGAPTLGTLLVILVVRWFLGPLSYAAGTPGGLFAPLLVLGAAAGSLLAGGADALLPSLGLSATAFAVVGMSSFFTAVVRAPVTGVVLIIEMTTATSLAVPMVIGAAAAMVTATLVRGPPVYETLRLRTELLESRARTTSTTDGPSSAGRPS